MADEQISARNINWTGLTGTEQLEKEGHPIVNQLAATGDLASRHPFLSLRIVDLKVESVDQLLAEYKGVALSYEVLLEAVEQNDTTTVLRLMTEYDIKAQWRSTWPSQGALLSKYPFLCSSFQDLSFRDISYLLNSYKELVLRCESLVAGIRRRVKHDPFADVNAEEFEIISAEESVPRGLYDQQHPPLITRYAEGGKMDDVSNAVSQSTVPTPGDGPLSLPKGEALAADRTFHATEVENRPNIHENREDGSQAAREENTPPQEIYHCVSIDRGISSKPSPETQLPKIRVFLDVVDRTVQMNFTFE